jgi:hypothetical protein
MKRVSMILILGSALCCHSLYADERLKLDKTTILGNGELPKVTFVVPWRDTPAAIPEWKPSPGAHPAVTHLDRELYHREVEFSKQLQLHRQRDEDTER